MTVEYHPALERELKEIRDFYEGRSPGLGGEFIDEFERQIAYPDPRSQLAGR